jgi:hypothetical protein
LAGARFLFQIQERRSAFDLEFRERNPIMSTQTFKTMQRALAASLLLLAVAACSTVPQPQVAKADIASQDAVVQGGD